MILLPESGTTCETRGAGRSTRQNRLGTSGRAERALNAVTRTQLERRVRQDIDFLLGSQA